MSTYLFQCMFGVSNKDNFIIHAVQKSFKLVNAWPTLLKMQEQHYTENAGATLHWKLKELL